MMLHAKLHDHRTISSVGDFLKVFTIYGCGSHPSWSCNLDHLYKFYFPLPKEASHKTWLLLANQI